jgi:hypothetical protein
MVPLDTRRIRISPNDRHRQSEESRFHTCASSSYSCAPPGCAVDDRYAPALQLGPGHARQGSRNTAGTRHSAQKNRAGGFLFQIPRDAILVEPNFRRVPRTRNEDRLREPFDLGPNSLHVAPFGVKIREPRVGLPAARAPCCALSLPFLTVVRFRPVLRRP